MISAPLASRGWEFSPEYCVAERFRKTGIFLTLLCMLYLSFGGLESYCYLIPTIDTRYAPECSELKFRLLVKVGMSREEVVQRIGEPLHKGYVHRQRRSHLIPRDERWSYTQDGAHPWGDWAWLSRELIIRDGRVVEKNYSTYYD
jgi:hypothetical protein